MARFEAGAAKVDITPPWPGVRLAGHGVNRRAVGRRDPLHARVLALSNGDAPLILASLDLIGFLRPDVQRVRAALPDLDPTRVWVCATHTHDGPDTIGLWGPMIGGVPLRCGCDRRYVDFVVERTATAISRAVAALRPARLVVAGIDAPTVGLTRNVRQPGMKNDRVQAIHVRDGRGDTIALAYHYACHPEFLGHTNRAISAEWPGVTAAALERDLGGVAPFFQDALGGMVTGAVARDDGAFEPMSGHPFVPYLGQRIAALVRRALREDAHAVAAPEIRTAHAEVDIPVANRFFRAAARLGVLRREFVSGTRAIRTEVNVARIGPLALATMPGEILPDVGFAVQRQLRARYPWVVNLGNDELGYLLSPSTWDHPGYAYERSMSIGPEAIPRLAAALDRLVSAV